MNNEEEVFEMREKFPNLGVSRDDKVISSNISRIGFVPAIHQDEEPDSELTSATIVEFKNGGTYMYLGTTYTDYDTFRHAESIGKHFHNFLKPLVTLKYNDTTQSWQRI